MERYSYRTLTIEISELGSEGFTQRLDGMGAEGWKLVATVVRTRHGHSHDVHLLFMQTLGAAR
ncbi:MAG: hypothetical protein KIT84_01960 [Labilithrix sp.]|nr:hypothetical protein [Labilithrix sp.]MCW5809753.1 hypothetical protein [Labilithrix sp.]